MGVRKKPIELTQQDCRILRGGIAALMRSGDTWKKFGANRQRLESLNRRLAELHPGQAISRGIDDEEGK